MQLLCHMDSTPGCSESSQQVSPLPVCAEASHQYRSVSVAVATELSGSHKVRLQDDWRPSRATDSLFSTGLVLSVEMQMPYLDVPAMIQVANTAAKGTPWKSYTLHPTQI